MLRWLLIALLLSCPAFGDKLPKDVKEAAKAYIKALTRQDAKGVIDALGEPILRTAEAYAVDPATGQAPSREEAIKKFLALEDPNRKFAPDIGDGNALGAAAWDVTLTWPNGEKGMVRVAMGEGKKWKIVDIDGRAEERQAALVAQAMRKIHNAERTWQGNDSDGNGQMDFWVVDVAGLHFNTLADGQVVGLLEEPIARADKTGLAAYVKDVPEPHEGFWFRVVPTDAEGKPYAEDPDGDGKATTSPGRFAVSAYPAEYGYPCTLTLILDENGQVYGKDQGAKALTGVEKWPGAEPAKSGWKLVN